LVSRSSCYMCQWTAEELSGWCVGCAVCDRTTRAWGHKLPESPATWLHCQCTSSVFDIFSVTFYSISLQLLLIKFGMCTLISAVAISSLTYIVDGHCGVSHSANDSRNCLYHCCQILLGCLEVLVLTLPVSSVYVRVY